MRLYKYEITEAYAGHAEEKNFLAEYPSRVRYRSRVFYKLAVFTNYLILSSIILTVLKMK